MISTLNFAVAVSVRVTSLAMFPVLTSESIVSSVKETASSVLGYDYDVDSSFLISLQCHN